jgi:hypothetical protein
LRLSVGVPTHRNKTKIKNCIPSALVRVPTHQNANKIMFLFLKTFFYPVSYDYNYNLPKEKVIEKLNEVFKKKVNFFSRNDMEGSFTTETTFELKLISTFNSSGIGMFTKLIGEIEGVQNETTKIKIKPMPVLRAYLAFFSIIVCAFIFLIQFILGREINFLINSFLCFFIGTLFVVIFSIISMSAIHKRFETNIDKLLRS